MAILYAGDRNVKLDEINIQKLCCVCRPPGSNIGINVNIDSGMHAVTQLISSNAQKYDINMTKEKYYYTDLAYATHTRDIQKVLQLYHEEEWKCYRQHFIFQYNHH